VKDKNTPIWFENVINGFEKPPANIHPSEYSWIYNRPDYTIENTSTIKDLENKIISLLNKNI
jgi:hypothetical protein